jgi:hypothetical protein
VQTTDTVELDADAIETIATVSDAVSSAAGLAAEDARRHAVLAKVRGSWNSGQRLPLDLVRAGMGGTCP